MFKTLSTVAATLLLAGAAQAASTVVDVSAHDDSWNGGHGAGLDTGVTLQANQSFSVTASDLDLWSAGNPLRQSDANGLTGNIYAVAGDDSGAAPGTQIGESFGIYDGFYFGELVGQIGSGTYFAVGTDFTGTANASGTLKLFYWDSNYADNSGAVAATVSTVPEPGSLALMLAGVGIIVGLARRRARH